MSATFIDANRPEVLVNKVEEPDVRFKRKQDGDSTPRLAYNAVYKSKLGSEASKAARTVKEMRECPTHLRLSRTLQSPLQTGNF